MKSPNEIGKNRTGIQASPLDSRQTTHGAEEGEPTSIGGESELAKVRLALAKEGEPVGSMPPPATIKGVAKLAATIIKGEHALLLLNLLGERLAFERTGVRLYEALLAKLPAFADGGDVGPTAAELREFQEQELRHVEVCRAAIAKLGGDATAMTPAADLSGVAGSGVLQVVCDPRAQLADSLHALLVAELVDNDGWDLLVQLARALGQDELADSFTRAADEEQQHLMRVRAWLTALVMREAGVAAEPTQPATT